MQAIDLNTSLHDVFQRPLHLALEQHQPELSVAAERYVVELLVDQAVQGGAEPLRQPVAMLYEQANRQEGLRRFESLRRLGDQVLYLCGFFREHVERRGLASEYVEGVGARAYSGVASMVGSGRRGRQRARPEHGSGPDVFEELADNFETVARCLSDVADALRARGAGSPRGVVELYERWLNTGSRIIAAELAERGVLVSSGRRAMH